MQNISSKTLLGTISSIILATQTPETKTINKAVLSVLGLVTELFPTIDAHWKREATDGPLKHTITALVECFVLALQRHTQFTPSDLIHQIKQSKLPNYANALSGGAETHIKKQLKVSVEWFGVGDKNVVQRINQWRGLPIETPIYKALWATFSKQTWYQLEKAGQDGEGIEIFELVMEETQSTFDSYLIDIDEDGVEHKGRKGFESIFVSEFSIRSKTKDIQDEWAKLDNITQSSYMDTMLQDMSTWTNNHVFGNETFSQYILNNPPTTDEQAIRVPFLPLEKMYVAAAYKDNNQNIPSNQNILNTLLLSNERLQIILANFGMGKSLTSRMYAAKLAQAHLKDSLQPIPIYIICRECLKGKQPLVGLAKLFEKAVLKFFARKDIRLATTHPAFPQFNEQQKYVFILDGFDEIYTTPEHQRQWFDAFEGELGENRCVIFSRPGVMRSIDCPNFTKIRTLKPFNRTQTEEWVERWNTILRHQTQPLEPQAFIKQNDTLEGLAILMFMYALICQQNSTPPTNRADIYNRFVLAVAAGKYQYTTSQQNIAKHKQIETTNQQLRAKLEATNEVILPNQTHSPDAQPMIWLLAHLAWKERCLYTDDERQQLNESDDSVPIKLTKVHLIEILNNKLGISTNEVEQYIPGAILAIQTNEDFHNGILFKHKSFKEFLCAKRWMFALQKWMNGHFDPIADNDLFEAPLAHPSEQTTYFLFDLVQLHTKHTSFAQRKNDALEHLENILNDLEMRARKPEPPQKEKPEQLIALTNPKNDLSWRIRRILFQVLCWLYPEGNDIESYYKPNIDLFWAFEFIEKFQSLQGLHLLKINLTGADLTGAFLVRAKLTGAHLRHVKLTGAFLTNADLNGTSLVNSSLFRAHLEGAYLKGASLCRANINGANLTIANLSQANLTSAFLSYANLTGANLMGASLFHAKLEGANLSYANLTGTNLKGAILHKAIFQNTKYNRTKTDTYEPTQWPKGFDPETHEGLVAIEDLEK